MTNEEYNVKRGTTLCPCCGSIETSHDCWKVSKGTAIELKLADEDSKEQEYRVLRIRCSNCPSPNENTITEYYRRFIDDQEFMDYMLKFGKKRK